MQRDNLDTTTPTRCTASKGTKHVTHGVTLRLRCDMTDTTAADGDPAHGDVLYCIFDTKSTKC